MSSKRYGKSSASLIIQKTAFFEENDRYLQKQRKIASVYKEQPKRHNCKNCTGELDLLPDFNKDGIDYVVCNNCSHLNGMHEDTDEFCEFLYTSDSGEDYAEAYHVEDINLFNYRTSTIYYPKAEFLYTIFLENNIDPHNFDYLDFGTGSGFMVSALKKMRLKNVTGVEVSKSQVDFGNSMMGDDCLSAFSINETNTVLRETKSQVVSLIHVLEHLQHPRDAMKQLMLNDNVEYLLIAVPTFGLSVYLEILSAEIMHRHLGHGHTHLYTEKSLLHLFEEFGFKVIGEWWFGTDMVDLFRQISVTLDKTNASGKMKELWKKDFTAVIDNVQLEIDKKQFSCETHMVLKKI